MSQTQVTLERPRLEGPGILSNVRAERPNLLPPFVSAVSHHSINSYNKELDSPSSRSLRIQGVLNLPKVAEISGPTDEAQSNTSAERVPSPTGSMTGLTLPPLSRPPTNWTECVETTSQVQPGSTYVPSSSQDTQISTLPSFQDSTRKTTCLASSPLTEETPSRMGKDEVMTPPSQMRGSPTTSSSQMTVSPSFHYQHSPRELQPLSDLHSSVKVEAMNGVLPTGSHHNSYHVMAMNLDNHSVPIPIDIKAGSRMADDKRKRNAGASARFRLRRKEKERETQLTIEHLTSKLHKAESELKELQLEREYLRLQRDQFFHMLNNRPVYTA